MRAECNPVEQRAEPGEEQRIEPCAPRAGAQPQQEQPREDGERVEQVERGAAEGAQMRARCAQRVEHEPEREAERERERREHRLIGDRGLHPKSLAQKPSPRGAVST